jgi:hypothetical protein
VYSAAQPLNIFLGRTRKVFEGLDLPGIGMTMILLDDKRAKKMILINYRNLKGEVIQ